MSDVIDAVAGRPSAEGEAPGHVGAGGLSLRRDRDHPEPGATASSRPAGSRPGTASSTSPPAPATSPSPRPSQELRSSPATSPLSFSRSGAGTPRPRESRSTGGRRTPRRCRSTTASSTAVLSCVGVMFAPHHQASADELVRVCRPGGTIGLICWTPEGFIGQMFAAMKPFAAPPPPGAQPPPLWGDEAHVRALLGDRVTDVEARREKPPRGPLRAAAGVPRLLQARLRADDRRLQGDRRRPGEGRRARRRPRRPGPQPRHRVGSGVLEWEYLLFTARRA